MSALSTDMQLQAEGTTEDPNPQVPAFLIANSPGLILNGQNVGGGFGFSMPVTTSSNISSMLTQAAGLTKSAFAGNTQFLNNVIEQQTAQQDYITQQAYQTLAQVNTISQQANQDTMRTNQMIANSSMSFITSACVEELGLAEAGEVIASFEGWRDEWLMMQEEGEKLRKMYERVAPALVRRINRSARKQKIYKRLYNFFILPAYHKIKQGKNLDVAKDYVACINYVKSTLRHS